MKKYSCDAFPACVHLVRYVSSDDARVMMGARDLNRARSGGTVVRVGGRARRVRWVTEDED